MRIDRSITRGFVCCVSGISNFQDKIGDSLNDYYDEDHSKILKKSYWILICTSDFGLEECKTLLKVIHSLALATINLMGAVFSSRYSIKNVGRHICTVLSALGGFVWNVPVQFLKELFQGDSFYFRSIRSRSGGGLVPVEGRLALEDRGRDSIGFSFQELNGEEKTEFERPLD